MLSTVVGLVPFLVLEVRLCATPHEQRVIAAVIAGEAASQGREGMVAVAEVIHQRVVESGWTPLRVVTHGNRRGSHAFSVLNQTTSAALISKWEWHPVYKTASELAQIVCEAPHKLPDTTHSANFFTRLGERPKWAHGRKPVAVIKDHAFYRIHPAAGARRAW